MNEHAKKIWQAWLDGRTVERRLPHSCSVSGVWLEANPSVETIPEQPQKCPERWRIKPEIYSRLCRVYYDKEYGKPCVIHGVEVGPKIDHRKFWECETEVNYCFGGWLSDWIEYETKNWSE